ncbi:hypothetical protein Tco_1303252 [Tanacetum coccineum]
MLKEELARNDVEESLWPRLIMVQKKEMWPTLRPRIDKELLVSCFQRKELDHRENEAALAENQLKCACRVLV